MSDRVRCFLVNKQNGQVTGRVATVDFADLPPGDVVIRVAWSSLNYKDALAATGHAGVAKKLPHVPGIDAAGEVVESSAAEFRTGDQVIVTGYELGAGRWGGYCELIRVPAEWIVPLPAGLTLRESMIFGTAGFTAARSLDALELHGVVPASGEVVVTGASGGVGSLAVAILARNGYSVAAVSGKPEAHDLLRELGAASVLGRDDVRDTSGKPLLAGRWAGAVDTVGGDMLATLLASTQQHGCVTACGLVGGADLHTTVYPFILRGVALAGIDSALCPMDRRRAIWNKLAAAWKPAGLEKLAHEISLDELPASIERILSGRMVGRTIVRVAA
jgi:acrylyl-CoA reductase (NADPH)